MVNFLDLFFFFFLLGLIKALGSYLLMLILLEVLVFLGLLFYLDMGDSGWVNQCFAFSLMYLVTMIFEGVFGLCLMLSLMRGEGSSQYLYWQ